MAFTSGFFNSYKGDRKYNAEQVGEIFDGVLADGIIPSQGQLFDVNSAENGMQITVGTGRAWFDHTWSKNDSVMVLTVEQSDITRPRYDTVVLEVNHEDDVRYNSIKIVKGVAAVNADKPILLNTDKVKQYPLAHILVRAGTEEIRAADIENWVGRAPTVFATGILETVAIDDLWSQWEGEWRDWFESIKLQLSGDIVTNLQYQIDQLREFDRSVLSSYTKGLYGLGEDGTPDDIFQFLYETAFKGHSFIKVSVKSPNNQLMRGISINITKSSGNFTNQVLEDGTFIMVTNSNEDVTISIPSDIADLSGSISTTAPETGVKEVTLTVNLVDFKLYTSSTSIRFSPLVLQVDYSLCGGGGGGGGGAGFYLYNGSSGSGYYFDTHSSGSGGGGGYAATGTMLDLKPYELYRITVGSGGSGGTSSTGPGSVISDPATVFGKPGGSSSIFSKSVNGGGAGVCSVQREIATGGSGNGNGGKGGLMESYSPYTITSPTSGTSGTGIVYTSFTETTTCGGGGGGGAQAPRTAGTAGSASGASGGNPKGGKGGSVSWPDNPGNGSANWSATAPSAGSTYGGGGGGGCARSLGINYSGSTFGNFCPGARGGNGVVSIRIYHKQ